MKKRCILKSSHLSRTNYVRKNNNLGNKNGKPKASIVPEDSPVVATRTTMVTDHATMVTDHATMVTDHVTMVTDHATMVAPIQYDTLEIKAADKEHPRHNSFGIQMISNSLRKCLFRDEKPTIPLSLAKQCNTELTKFGLNQTAVKADKTLKINFPEEIKDLRKFFDDAAMNQLDPYLSLIKKIVSNERKVELPTEWSKAAGWTKYTAEGSVPVEYPTCGVLVFDVEVCIKGGNNLPSLAVAMSPNYCYTWVSPGLDNPWMFSRTPSTDMLIPLGTGDKVVIGHNVMYDRARVREEYNETRSGLRFLDTLSLHVCVSGLENSQKGQWLAADEFERFDKEWMKVGSPNSLSATHKLYCGSPLDKTTRDIFVTGDHSDVQENFTELMKYCAKDVLATLDVLKCVWPLFSERFPSPVTLAGMFEMAGCYIPVSENWDRYIREADDMFYNKQGEMKQVLCNLADDVMLKFHTNRHKTLSDTWTSQLNWDSKKILGVRDKKRSKKDKIKTEDEYQTERRKVWSIGDVISTVCQDKPDKPKHYLGAPEWYRNLCPKASSYHDLNFTRGTRNISLSTQISPLLLQLCCHGHPLYHTHHHGWGYLTEKSKQDVDLDKSLLSNMFPGVNVLDHKPNKDEGSEDIPQEKSEDILEEDSEDILQEDISSLSSKYGPRIDKLQEQITLFSKKDETPCVFLKYNFNRITTNATHKGNVGNPLGKMFTDSIENGTISSRGDWAAQHVLTVGTGLTFWRNTRRRIMAQFVVQLQDTDLNSGTGHRGSEQDRILEINNIGVILPIAVPAGTLTRRSTEPLWLTASNVRPDRVGSEFKGVVSSFPGYSFVGADVDSQELWIASLIGDSVFGDHGASPLGWMSLQGQKSEGTDMHSKTAEQLSQGRPGLVSRDVAKAFNYARIYGAGKGLACSMMRDNCKDLTQSEITSIIDNMFSSTKGAAIYKLTKIGTKYAKFHNLVTSDGIHITEQNLKLLAKLTGMTQYRLANKRTSVYQGGSESAMFNRLEEIARSDHPETPCLNSRITRSLEPGVVKSDQMRSRINWVVQSSAVDFLHLLLVSMKWFMKEYGIPGRFSISIHDEVRFHVPDDKVYECALALQFSNLLTRALFCAQLNINDLPNNIAFFSGVEVDKCLRKNVNNECITPSNPLGLSLSYNIPPGEELDIFQLMEKTNTLKRGGT